MRGVEAAGEVWGQGVYVHGEGGRLGRAAGADSAERACGDGRLPLWLDLLDGVPRINGGETAGG